MKLVIVIVKIIYLGLKDCVYNSTNFSNRSPHVQFQKIVCWLDLYVRILILSWFEIIVTY